MKVSLNWLREYVDIACEPKEYADRMTMSGTKVEAIEEKGEGVKNLVIGRIEEITQHPDADKLVVTQINVGAAENVQIVTGASNVRVGDIIPVALDGAILPTGQKIKNGKLRGVPSNGMLCSAEELNIESKYVNDRSKGGIYILSEDYTIGQDAVEALGLRDTVIEFELTANRPDCRAIIGIAKETAATLDTAYRAPELSVQHAVEGEISAKVSVDATDLCPRFVMREVRDIVIAPSPAWMQQRLMSFGIRPINNIVDITNYVMAELGQPLHAYDLDQLKSKEILVRRARAGERMTTLDGQEFELDPEVLLITDGEKAIGMAGVMGGQNSQITDNTKHILLEAALFDADNVRLTSRRLGIRTDASSNFEKGIDPERQRMALDRACHLIELLGAGTVVDAAIDVRSAPTEEIKIESTFSYVRALLGEDLSDAVITELLERLFFTVNASGDKLELIVPPERLDMRIREDIVEEVARLYGYNNIQAKPIIASVTQAVKSKERQFEDLLKQLAFRNALTEIQTYSFISPASIEKAGVTEPRKLQLLSLLNPLGEETSVMRTTLIPGILNVTATNLAHKNAAFAAFELGNTFFSTDEELPREEKSFVAAVYGEKEDFFTMKARLEGILRGIGISAARYERQEENKTFHPGRCADVYEGEHRVATIGEVHPSVMQQFGIKKRVYLFELDIPAAMHAADLELHYSSVPKYPAISVDIAVVVDKTVPVGTLEQIIRKNGKKTLESVALFDIFESEQIGADKKSVAYALIFRAKDRTLTDEEVNKVVSNILTKLEEEAGAKLREA